MTPVSGSHEQGGDQAVNLVPASTNLIVTRFVRQTRFKLRGNPELMIMILHSAFDNGPAVDF